MKSLDEIAADQIFLASSTDMGEEEFERVSAMTTADQVRHFYVSGECHVFAEALHLITGWPVFNVSAPEHGHFHRLVRSPDGRLLDAAGWTDESGLRRRYRLRRLTVSPVPDRDDPFDAFSREDGIFPELADAVAAIRQLPGEPFAEPWFSEMSARPVAGADIRVPGNSAKIR